MTISLSTFYAQLNNLIPDIPDSELSQTNRRQQIKAAVRAYSMNRPDQVTGDITGDGGQYYAITGLTSWQDEFSQILTMQYPAPTVASDEAPVYLNPEDWDADYYDGSVRYIYFPNHSPAATEKVRVRYTAPYTWAAGTTTTSVTQITHGFSLNDPIYQKTSGAWEEAESLQLLATHIVSTVTDTNNFVATELAVGIPDMHFFAICHKAACLCCQQIATKYSRTADSTIGADSVDHAARGEAFSRRADEFCRIYAETLGLSGGSGEAGQARPEGYAQFVDWDNAPRWPPGRRFIFHNEDVS